MSRGTSCIMGVTYISYAADGGTFEFLVIQLVDGDFEVSSSLEFHESAHGQWRTLSELILDSSPFTIAITSDFRVHNVKSRATREIFEILGSK